MEQSGDSCNKSELLLLTGAAPKWTPSIARPKRVLKASKEQLLTFLSHNTTPEDLPQLGLSQIGQLELRRHCFAIATRGMDVAKHKLLFKEARVSLSCYATFSRVDLLQMALEAGILDPDSSEDIGWGDPYENVNDDSPDRNELLALLSGQDGTSMSSLHSTWTGHSEVLRRTMTEECLLVLRTSLPHHLFLNQAQCFLDWAKADIWAFSSAAKLEERLGWLEQLATNERLGNALYDGVHGGDQGFAARVVNPMVRFIRRHCLAFLQHRPELMPFDFCNWKSARLGCTLRSLGVEMDPVLNQKTGPSFFAVNLLEESKELQERLRIPQLQALEALKEKVGSTSSNVKTEHNADVRGRPLQRQYEVLSLLRVWFADVLSLSYQGIPIEPECRIEGENHRKLLKKEWAGLESSAGEAEHPLMIVLPTGVGKTVVMCLAPYVYQAQRVLVLSPNVRIREQLADAFKYCYQRMGISNSSKKETNSGPNIAYYEDDGLLSKDRNHDVWICNTQRLQGDSLLRNSFARDFFDVVLIDEAHHAEAFSYRLIRDHFQAARFLLLTATPFRGDGKQIDAETIYTCTMTYAIEMGYLKNICYAPIVIDTVLGIRKDGSRQVLQGSQLPGLANELCKVSVHSEAAIAAVMSVAMKRVREMRRNSTAIHHQIIMQATNLDHMSVLVRVWQKHPDNSEKDCLSIDYVASSRGDDVNQKVLDRLKSGRLDAIVHVGMLGEGFDHPPLSICCIFRRFGSFAPYAQFVGRVVRRLSGDGVTDADNKGYIVAHPALGLDRHWKVFSEADERLPDDKMLKSSGGANTIDQRKGWLDLQDHVLSSNQAHGEKWFITS